MNWIDNVEHYAGDVVTVSGNELIGIALNNAKAGEIVSVALGCGSGCIEIEDDKKIEPETYKVPTIKIEVPKIELD